MVIGVSLIIVLACWATKKFLGFHNNGTTKLTINNIRLKKLPCQAASQAELGYPSAGGPTAEFTTNGGELYFYAKYFPHGVLNLGKQTNVVDIGLAETSPIWDDRNSITLNASQKIRFTENNYGKTNLLPGRYWLWSGAGDVVVYSCDPNGVSDPKPVR